MTTSQNLWSNFWGGGGLRFHLAGAVTKINDLIFVVLARWQHLHAGWLTLLSLSFFPFSQPTRLLPLTLLGDLPWNRQRSLHPHKGENVQSSEQMRWEDSWHSPAQSWWPGPVLGSWERGKRSRGGGGGSGADSAADSPLISITSCSHKLNWLSFLAWQHINRALLRKQPLVPMKRERQTFRQIQ